MNTGFVTLVVRKSVPGPCLRERVSTTVVSRSVTVGATKGIVVSVVCKYSWGSYPMECMSLVNSGFLCEGWTYIDDGDFL